MNNRPRYNEGKRKEIVRLLLSNGCIPYRDIKYVTDNASTFARQLWKMKTEGVVDKGSRNGEGYYVLKDFERNKGLITESYDEKSILYQYYKNFGKTDVNNMLNGEPYRIRRGIRNAESGIFMEYCGVTSEIGQKSSLYKSSLPEGTLCYYNSRELKGADSYTLEVDEDTKEVIGRTYINGLLISPGGTYAVIDAYNYFLSYNMGEIRINIYIANLVAEKHLPKYKGCIILVRDYDVLTRFFTYDNITWQRGMTNLFGAYSKVYGISMETDGREMIKLITMADWDETLNRNYLSDKPKSPYSVVDCDGEESGNYYLNFCIPDIKKLYNFLNAAEQMNEPSKFHIICFDTQQEYIQKISKGLCKIYTLPLSEYLTNNL